MCYGPWIINTIITPIPTPSLSLNSMFHVAKMHLAPPIDDMIERNSVNITLHDVDPAALRQLIDYTYTGEITITEDNVQVINFY